jgi:hypothetical protein
MFEVGVSERMGVWVSIKNLQNDFKNFFRNQNYKKLNILLSSGAVGGSWTQTHDLGMVRGEFYHCATALRHWALSIMTLSIVIFFVTLSKKDPQHNDTRHKHKLLFCWVLLCWVSLCWVTLCWVTLCWMSICWVSWCPVLRLLGKF